ncbi:unnamed protein product, partial [Allacma fusca]
MGNSQLVTSLGYQESDDRTCDCSRKSKYFERERCSNVACCRKYSFGRLLNANHDMMMRIGSAYSCSQSNHDFTGPDDRPFMNFNGPYIPFGQSVLNAPFFQSQQRGSGQPQKPGDSSLYNPVTNTLRGHEPLNPFNPNNLQSRPDQSKTRGDKNNYFTDPNNDKNQSSPYKEPGPNNTVQGKSNATGSSSRPINGTRVPATQGRQGAPTERDPRGQYGPESGYGPQQGPGSGPGGSHQTGTGPGGQNGAVTGPGGQYGPESGYGPQQRPGSGPGDPHQTGPEGKYGDLTGPGGQRGTGSGPSDQRGTGSGPGDQHGTATGPG